MLAIDRGILAVFRGIRMRKLAMFTGDLLWNDNAAIFTEILLSLNIASFKGNSQT